MLSITGRTVCTAESTTESLSAISHTFQNVVEKRNPYRSVKRRRHRFCLCPTIYHIYQGVSWPYHGSAHACKTTT
jgi:hypothetical protein